jgi:hypothetical protein
MTQADSVHSTPPTNTSATNPLDQARRHFLTVAAGGALAAVAITTAAQAAGSPADPIFAVIEAHRKAQAVAEAAFAESSPSSGSPMRLLVPLTSKSQTWSIPNRRSWLSAGGTSNGSSHASDTRL